MPQDRFNLTGRAVLLAAIAAAYPVIGYSAPAARVDFAVGNVTAVGSNGQSRALGKGAQIEQGDTVNTNGGRAQLRFTDGAYVSLQPESQFRIDQYRYDGKQDGNEKGFFSLLKGGLRTITGLVGRSNKANYQVTTSVATIGIRGTEYTIQYGNSVTGTVGEGQIEVCNGAGCLSVTNGESYYVQTQEIKPVLTNKRTDLPPPEPTQPPSNFTQGNNVDSSGNPVLGAVLTGTHGDLNIATVGNCCPSIFIPPALQLPFGTIAFDANGVATAIDGSSITKVTDFGNDGIIAWGFGLDSSGFPLHYVAGIPTSPTDLALLAINNPVATYSVLRATTPTAFSCGPLVAGQFTGATLSANFATGLVDASVSVLFGTSNITGVASGTLNRGNAGFVNSFSASGSSCTVGTSCFVSMNGFFAGVNAIRAGLTYAISGVTVGSPTGSSATVTGAVAFTKNP